MATISLPYPCNGRVDQQSADLDVLRCWKHVRLSPWNRLSETLMTSNVGIDASDDLCRAERLGDIVVCPQTQAKYLVRFLPAGTQEEDRKVKCTTYGATHLEPITLR